MTASIAIVGDFDSRSRSHAATNQAIGHAASALGVCVQHRWVATAELAGPDSAGLLGEFRAIWVAPGSPYQSMEGALAAIRFARERRIPLLGTCGGFQHVILEYARNVLGFADAQHAEYAPDASRLVISRLACSLVGRSMTITLQPDSLVARLCGRRTVREQYHCNFGVNPDYVSRLRASALRVVGSDDEGEVRIVELSGHPFFVGTLFVPQLTSTADAPHALISGFLRAGLGDPAA